MGEGKGSGTVTEVIEGFIIIGDCKKLVVYVIMSTI